VPTALWKIVIVAVDHLLLRRLAYIRYFYHEGVIEASRPHPLSAKAISTFHDAVEHLLRLVAEQVNVNPPKKSDFMEYWSFLRPGLPGGNELPSKKTMERLNRIRVLHKHLGTIPSRDDVEQTRADVLTFLTDATALAFGVDFATVDLADLVAGTVAEVPLDKAHELALSGEYVEALAHLSAAFELLLNDYLGRKRNPPGGPFDFGPALGPFDRVPRELAPLDKLAESTKALQKAVRIIACGIEYTRYARFAL
jgi:hypothetical protein